MLLKDAVGVINFGIAVVNVKKEIGRTIKTGVWRIEWKQDTIVINGFPNKHLFVIITIK